MNVDDFMIYAPDTQTHDTILENIIVKIKESGLKLNKQKCKCYTSEVMDCYLLSFGTIPLQSLKEKKFRKSIDIDHNINKRNFFLWTPPTAFRNTSINNP